MKKNKMLRIASILLVVTLLSTCVISGTFAKYVTKAEGSDEARVAKWGVLVSLNAGNAFSNEYKTHDDTYTGGISVKSEDNAHVVAPGTSAEDIDAVLAAGLKGKPEVATRYSLVIDEIKDINLPAGKYTDYTYLCDKDEDGKLGYEDTFTLDKDYAPLVWTMKINDAAVATDKSMTEILARTNEIAGKIEGLHIDGISNVKVTADSDTITISFDAAPNFDINLNATLTWKWAFEQEENVELYDKADTFLGNWAAVKMGQEIEGFVEPAAPANTTVSAKVTASATQID